MLTGCGLDDAQIIGVTSINNQYAKGSKPSAKERLAKIISIVPAGHKNLYNDNRSVDITQAIMTLGLDKPYYIANAPNEPQSDTHHSLLIRFPKGTATGLLS
jgi:hypothetical protein